MHITTAINHRDRALMALRETIGSARITKISYREILRKIAEVRCTISHCPQWVRSYFDGYADCLLRSLWDDVEYCYLLRGVLYSTHRNSTHPTTERLYKKKLGAYIAKHKGRHYWKGTDKVYS